jgi:hypothetical protein
MAILGDIINTATDAWNGSNKVWGDVAATAVDTAEMIPEVGGIIKGAVGDGKEVGGYVNQLTGADEEGPTQGNVGNHVGTVLGGAAGLALSPFLGPMGVAEGAALGSTAGGWLADTLGLGDGTSAPPTASGAGAPMAQAAAGVAQANAGPSYGGPVCQPMSPGADFISAPSTPSYTVGSGNAPFDPFGPSPFNPWLV